MSRASQEKTARTEAVVIWTFKVVGLLLVAFLVYAGITIFSTPQTSRLDDTLPNPMGGPARTPPGDAVGEAALGGLRIEGADVRMGEVALGVTYVPGWKITNPTDAAVTFVVGHPQVVEGCCPGPVYVDGELTQVGQEFHVPPGGQLLLQFPLQMHRGMEGPHHLTVPLASGKEQTAVHVTGDLTPSAPA